MRKKRRIISFPEDQKNFKKIMYITYDRICYIYYIEEVKNEYKENCAGRWEVTLTTNIC